MEIREISINENRRKTRIKVVNEFLKEEPGTGKGEESTKYRYNVETLQNGDKIYLKRPAPLNKGFDFEIHVENISFKDKGSRKSMPSHTNIIEDLRLKKYSDSKEYEKVNIVINKLYNCEEVKNNEYSEIYFKEGYPIELILKSIKWLFIEQDITYWNWSGRHMLYSALKDEKLCW